MSQFLTRQQIAVLYGLPEDTKEVYAHGARIKHSVPGARRRKVTLDDFGSKAHDEHYDRLMKTPGKPAVQVIESEVTEIEIF